MAELAPKGTDRWRRTGRDETSVEDIKADQKNHVVGEVELPFVKREVREGDLLRVDRVARQPPEFSAVWAYTPYSGLRDEAVKFFETETAEWNLCIQLCTDLDKMPVEDASVKWPEELSPYVPVARITAGPQNAYSVERRVYVDENLSFNPWHCLAAHRPLGNIMRARFEAYKASSQFRHSTNGREVIEPKSIDELPD